MFALFFISCLAFSDNVPVQYILFSLPQPVLKLHPDLSADAEKIKTCKISRHLQFLLLTLRRVAGSNRFETCVESHATQNPRYTRRADLEISSGGNLEHFAISAGAAHR